MERVTCADDSGCVLLTWGGNEFWPGFIGTVAVTFDLNIKHTKYIKMHTRLVQTIMGGMIWQQCSYHIYLNKRWHSLTSHPICYLKLETNDHIKYLVTLILKLVINIMMWATTAIKMEINECSLRWQFSVLSQQSCEWNSVKHNMPFLTRRLRKFLDIFFKVRHPVALSYNYYINKQSTQLIVYKLMQHISICKRS